MEHTRKHTAGAFTLIELLVVIAVIALLISILLPALANAKLTTRLTVCQANVRGQNQALLSYTLENDDCLPPKLIWWGEVQENGSYASIPWQINSFLARYLGAPFPKPSFGFPNPTDMWRCPDVAVDDDRRLRQTHDGILHHAPNFHLFNWVIDDPEIRKKDVFADAHPPWDKRYGLRHQWRRATAVFRPERIVTLMDNVNYYEKHHSHRDARAAYGRAFHVITGDSEDYEDDNQGSHDALKKRPAAYLDGHADPMPSDITYWLQEANNYRPRFGGSYTVLYKAEVRHLMWYVDPGEEMPAGGDE